MLGRREDKVRTGHMHRFQPELDGDRLPRPSQASRHTPAIDHACGIKLRDELALDFDSCGRGTPRVELVGIARGHDQCAGRPFGPLANFGRTLEVR